MRGPYSSIFSCFQLFKPAAKVPTTAAETFFLSASDGDVKGMWFILSPLVLKLSIPVVALSLACKLITGEDQTC